MGGEKRQKYFVNRQDSITVKCPACGRTGVFPAERLRGQQHAARVGCPCGEDFTVEIEFRQDYRRKTEITGTVRALTTPRERARPCTIADQSSGGLLLRLDGEVPVKRDDRLIVSYPLDAQAPHLVERIISVRHYDLGLGLGGAFIDEQGETDHQVSRPPVH